MPDKIQLTKYSHGAGCGCKIAPSVLEKILQGSSSEQYAQLLVGNDTKDDAAVYDLGNGKTIISTTDFFMPIVNDPFDFGRIAAANSLSDVYAMGGKPLMAIAILGWPVEKIPAEVATEVLNGARAVCKEAGIPLAGGHSIDSPEPIFGLAVTGECDKNFLKKNSTATEGSLIYLTKPLGVGMITTAQKKGKAKEQDYKKAVEQMTALNSIGTELGKMKGVNALTDVTGFGLLGHLIEMCEGSGLSAEIEYDKIPMLPNLDHYIKEMIYPDITFRNWKSIENKVKLNDKNAGKEIFTLCDPQTSGGLMIAVQPDNKSEVEKTLKKQGIDAQSFGVFRVKNPILVAIN